MEIIDFCLVTSRATDILNQKRKWIIENKAQLQNFVWKWNFLNLSIKWMTRFGIRNELFFTFELAQARIKSILRYKAICNYIISLWNIATYRWNYCFCSYSLWVNFVIFYIFSHIWIFSTRIGMRIIYTKNTNKRKINYYGCKEHKLKLRSYM